MNQTVKLISEAPFDTPVVKMGSNITRICNDDISPKRVTSEDSDWRVTNMDSDRRVTDADSDRRKTNTNIECYNSYSHHNIRIRQNYKEERCNAEKSKECSHYEETYYYNKETTSNRQEKQNKEKKEKQEQKKTTGTMNQTIIFLCLALMITSNIIQGAKATKIK